MVVKKLNDKFFKKINAGVFLKNQSVDTVQLQCPICGFLNFKKPFFYEAGEDGAEPVIKKLKSFVCNSCNAEFRNRLKLPKK